ncbi:MAG: hypothetical protein Q8K36_05920 [Alphaproteobacteria bacterium]|nr:hypothetical protein [Alphaproteobacteria bacterium]
MIADQKRLLKTLTTLIKVEDTAIRDLKNKMSLLSNQIDELETELATMKERIHQEKTFMKSDLIFHDDLARYLRHADDRKQKILSQKIKLEEEWQKYYDQLIEHAKSQKSYESVHLQTKKDIQEMQDLKDRNALDDLILMRRGTDQGG